MKSKSSVTRRNRIAALAGIALISIPLMLVPVLRAGHAHSAEVQPTAVSMQAMSGSLADIIEADRPAVVTVIANIHAQEAQEGGGPQFGPGSPFDEFFRQFFGENGPMHSQRPMPTQPPQQQPKPQAEALGSGFIIGSDGTIVTNNHVIDGATEIKVIMDDGSEHVAKLVGQDAKTDLAVLKIESGKVLPTVSWGDSETLRVGDAVVAIGNPFGIGTTVTSGIVSARGRDLHNGPYDDFIQVDAAINHGNSGGPLINMEGRVIGINTAIYSPNGGNVGVGFAIPSAVAQRVVEALIKDGSIAHGYLGVRIQSVTPEIADALGLKDKNGALVAGVEPDSPASKGGIQAGDIILTLNGKAVRDSRDLSRSVADLKPGATQDIGVLRNGKTIDVNVAIGDGNVTPKTPQQQPALDGEQAVPDLGIGLSTNPSGEGGGVVVSLDPEKPGAMAGLREGDIISGVNQQAETSPSAIADAVHGAAQAGRTSVLLQVERGGQQVFVAIPFAQG